MPRPRLEAHLVALASSANRQASMTNLLGFDFDNVVTADAVFPRRLGTMAVFVRVFNRAATPRRHRRRGALYNNHEPLPISGSL